MTLRNAFLIALALFLPLAAWAGKPPQHEYIRDAEIEANLKEFATPAFQQMGINPDSVTFVIVNDPTVNAFVAGGQNMFVTTALLRETRNVGELIGVMAHESGHIAGGHLVRTADEIRSASITALVSTLFGVAAAAGAGDAGAGGAAISLGQQVAERTFLAYSRTQESSADQAALVALDKAQISAEGMLAFLQRLEDQELLPDDQQIQYVRTHPMTRDRVDAVAAHVRDAPPVRPIPAEFKAKFARMEAKLAGYLDPRGTLVKVGANPTGFEARYAASIARHQTGDTAGAVKLADSLIKDEPKNPYLYELRGQILYETGQARLAVASYQEAVRLYPQSALLRVGLGQALIDTGDELMLGEAISQLEAAANIERREPRTWHLLATAYGRQKNLGMAAYALAEEASVRGDKKESRAQAKRAQDLLAKGSPGWIKASDLLVNVEKSD